MKGVMSERSFLILRSTVVLCLLSFACGEDFIVLGDRDASVGNGAGGNGGFGLDGVSAGTGGDSGTNGSSGNESGGSGDGVDAGQDASDDGAICATNADCDDEDTCTGAETCVSGVCQSGASLSCTDNNPCTADLCVPATGACLFAALANGSLCEDANMCDGQTCNNGVCGAPAAFICADDGNACTSHTCDPSSGRCVLGTVTNGGSCNDATVCNGSETCTDGACLPGVALNCDDGNPCTDDTCDGVTGCAHANRGSGASCSDGNVCNGSETCNGSGACLPGTPLVCQSNDVCVALTCNPANGACLPSNVANGTPCPDGNLCDGQTCNNGVCGSGTAVLCAADTDNNPCTANQCNPATGQCLPGNADGVACATDGNQCTNDVCTAGACQHPNVVLGTQCNNGNACDGNPDTCAPLTPGAVFQCFGGFPITCNDNQVCTTDTCNPASGCVFTNLTAGTPCPDGNLCDGATCSGSTCQDGPDVVCNDSQVCTTDSCTPATGACAFTNITAGTPCPDGDLCDGATCSGGACNAGTAVVCSDDGQACTSEACVAATGVCASTNLNAGTPCPDSDLCDGDTCSISGTCTDNPPEACTLPQVCTQATGVCQ